MKAIAFVTLISALPYVAQAAAVPEFSDKLVPVVRTVAEDGTVVARADDEEWTVVIFSENESGGQCGGTSQQVAGGSSGGCKEFKSSMCANIKVNAGIASCDFKFNAEGCSLGQKKDLTVQGGKDSNGVNLNADAALANPSDANIQAVRRSKLAAVNSILLVLVKGGTGSCTGNNFLANQMLYDFKKRLNDHVRWRSLPPNHQLSAPTYGRLLALNKSLRAKMEREDESSSDDDSHGESTSENDTGNEQHAEDTVIGAADNIDNIDSTDANATGGIGGIGDNEEGDKVMTNSHCVPMIEDDNGSVGKGDVSKGAAMKRKSSNDGGDGDGDSGHHGDMGGGSEWHRSSFHQPTAVQQRQKENSNKNSGAAAAAKKQKVKSQVTSPEDAEFGRKGKAPVRQIQWSHPSDNGEGSSSRQEALTSDDPMSNTYDSTSRSDDQEVVRPKDLNLEFDNSALIMKEFGDKYGRH
ncbi:putative AA1-like domain-containing protein, partial [Seiridium cardinale]